MNQAKSVSPQAIMAAAVLDANARGASLEIEGVSELFLELAKKGIGLGEIALRKVPGGVYSDDAEAFVGRFLAAGYATARSPITFSEKGVDICKKIVEKECSQNSANLEKALSILGLSVPEFK
ncbi:MAG: hypothetical protein DMG65_01500 [Candidatus Angelobacter sp. Gp1-AA117]|nr:MAG: hypothetical protein DMG65_01500 [Candidatus Angelobacter sp. Gp1-AA117]